MPCKVQNEICWTPSPATCSSPVLSWGTLQQRRSKKQKPDQPCCRSTSLFCQWALSEWRCLHIQSPFPQLQCSSCRRDHAHGWQTCNRCPESQSWTGQVSSLGRPTCQQWWSFHCATESAGVQPITGRQHPIILSFIKRYCVTGSNRQNVYTLKSKQQTKIPVLISDGERLVSCVSLCI